jgi:hypothetical protein
MIKNTRLIPNLSAEIFRLASKEGIFNRNQKLEMDYDKPEYT